MTEEKPLLILPDWLVTSALEAPKKKWGLRILGSEITHVASHKALLERFPEEQRVLAGNQALLPGFVNTHTHMYGVLAHGIPLHKAPADFWGFLDDFWWPLIENGLDHQMINAATALRCYHLIQSGVTTFYDCTEAPNALPGCLESQAEVVNRFGLRAILSFEATERMGAENGRSGLQENASMIKACKDRQRIDPDYLVSGLMCHHTLFTCSPDFIREAYELALENEVLLHAHVAEGTYEPEYALRQYGKRTLQVYDELGVAGPHFLASQCVQIDPGEVDLLAARGIRVAHMPLSNCEVGGGIAPVPDMISKGATPGLGSDGYIDDFYEIMRGAFLIHKAARQDPQVMPANRVWYMATEGGARTLALEKVGRIAEGWKADLQLVDTALPTPLEEHNFYEQMLLYRNSTHVRAVMINGKFKMEAGIIPIDDLNGLTEKVHEQANRLWKEARI